MAAPTQFAFRHLKGIGIVDAAPVYEPLPGFEKPEGNLRCCSYSPCGRYFAWATSERVNIIDASVGHIITTLPTENVYELGFSPLGTFVITWQRSSKDEAGDAVKNLKVWRVVDDATGGDDSKRETVGKFVQKSQTGWNLQYTYDERFCARVVTNQIQIYESGDLTKVWNRIHVEGVADFAISPGENHSIAVFVPERKGQPAAVKVFNVPQFDSPVSQKSFFKGDKVQLKWNNAGTSLIVLAQTEVDKTGKSYYGETTLYLLSANGGFDSRIDLDKEGPIHDVSWSPNSKEFGVVYGSTPSKTTIFNLRAVATHSFPLGPRNTILFSPHGRFVLVAGFGNFAGHTDIYDLEKDYTKICTIQAANTSVCEWSPDGKYILTATTSPRLRVDNGIRIWHVGGGLMFNEDHHELYHVTWRPQSPTMYPLGNPLNPVPAPHSSALKFLETVKTPSKPAGAYRPPGARGQITPLAYKREDEGGSAFVRNEGATASFGGGVNGFGKSRRREVPGAESVDEQQSQPLPPGAAPGGGVSLTTDGDEKLSKAAAKNKKKREAKKAKEAAEKSGEATPDLKVPTGPKAESRSPERKGGRGHERSRSKGYAPAGNTLDGNRNQRRDRSRSEGQHQRQRGDTASSSGAYQSQPNGFATTPKHPPGLPINTAKPMPSPIITTAPPPIPADAPELQVTSPTTPGGSSADKKMRGLLKKIRAIDDLKMRLAGGEKLEDTQMKKIHSEESVRKELMAAGYTG